MFPRFINNFIEKFSHIPSIGPRLATRLAFYLSSLNDKEFDEIASSLKELKNMNHCTECFSLKLKNDTLCTICALKERNRKIIAIVERETDIEAIEKSRVYNGTYLTIGEAPHNGVLTETQKKRLRKLKDDIEGKTKNVEEIIIALPQNSFGDFMSEIIIQGFKKSVPKITRLGRGIPTGGTVEFADEETLKDAIEKRN